VPGCCSSLPTPLLLTTLFTAQPTGLVGHSENASRSKPHCANLHTQVLHLVDSMFCQHTLAACTTAALAQRSPHTVSTLAVQVHMPLKTQQPKDSCLDDSQLHTGPRPTVN
jgi:hypothetical protein